MTLKRELDLQYIFISHDLNVVEYISDRIMVMYLGNCRRTGTNRGHLQPTETPLHPRAADLQAQHRPASAHDRTDHPGRNAQSYVTANRLPLSNALRICGRCVCCPGTENYHRGSDGYAPSRMSHGRSPILALARRRHVGMTLSSTMENASANGVAAELERISVTIPREGQILRPVRDVSISVARGETLCIIGESGSGKSLTLRALIGLLPRGASMSGTIRLAGRDITNLSAEERRRIRGARIGMIFQEPATALDPVYTVGHQIAEAIMAHETWTLEQARARALELLELVSIQNAARRFHAFPHEMSGGMRQRAMISIALACQPDILLADEPTTALDVTVQMQILLLLRKLQQLMGMSVIFVTHDIAVAAETADHIAVMYAGTIVEIGSAQQVLLTAKHPYTRALLELRSTGARRGQPIPMISGAPPNPADLPNGCAFHPRCRLADDICRTSDPEFQNIDEHRRVRCWMAAAAPKEIQP